MQREIEDRLSELMLSGELESGHRIKVDFVDGEFTFHNELRGERISVGVNTGGDIPSTPELAAGGVNLSSQNAPSPSQGGGAFSRVLRRSETSGHCAG